MKKIIGKIKNMVILIMIWQSKHPPIYCFPGDYWIRETDKKTFRMKQNCFESNDEIIPYEKKQKLCKSALQGENND